MGNELEISSVSKIGEPSSSIILAAAKLPPRDLVAVEKNIRTAIQNNPALAEICIYCRPVGKKEGKQQFAFGPSIRFTEIGQQCFGRLWLNGTVEQDTKRIMATVACFDLSTMNITFGTCSKSIIGKGGQTYSASMIEVTSNAAISIARRNALLQQMRPQLESCMIDAKNAAIKKWCKGADLSYGEAWKGLCEDYKKRWGTTESTLKRLVEDEGSPEDKLTMLIGVRNYLIDNPDGYGDVFGQKPAPQSKGSASTPGTEQEPPKQTEKQRYNTICLQLDSAGKQAEKAEIIAEHMGKLPKGKEMSEDEFKTLNEQLEKELKNEPPAA